MLALLLLLLTATPTQAAHIAGSVGGEDPSQLRAIAWRESRLQRVGVHGIDAWAGRKAWTNAASVGALEPSWCPFHRLGPSPRQWATRGSWGHMAAYAVPYLGCVPPWVLDIPTVSAWVAVLRLRASRKPWAVRALKAWADA